jgi:hypothetical protein
VSRVLRVRVADGRGLMGVGHCRGALEDSAGEPRQFLDDLVVEDILASACGGRGHDTVELLKQRPSESGVSSKGKGAQRHDGGARRSEGRGHGTCSSEGVEPGRARNVGVRLEQAVGQGVRGRASSWVAACGGSCLRALWRVGAVAEVVGGRVILTRRVERPRRRSQRQADLPDRFVQLGPRWVLAGARLRSLRSVDPLCTARWPVLSPTMTY